MSRRIPWGLMTLCIFHVACHGEEGFTDSNSSSAEDALSDIADAGTPNPDPDPESETDAEPVLHNDALPSSIGAATDASRQVTVVWNGEDVKGGSGWGAPPTNPVIVQREGARSPPNAIAWQVNPFDEIYSEGGFNWKSAGGKAVPLAGATHLRFSIKVTGSVKPRNMRIALRGSRYSLPAGERGYLLEPFASNFTDGLWHVANVPLATLLAAPSAFDFVDIQELFFSSKVGGGFTVLIDDIELVQ